MTAILEADCDQLVLNWLIAPKLARGLLGMAEWFTLETGRPLSIISGYRTRADQLKLEQKGRPAAPWQLSTHTICPAQGADLRMDGFVSRQHKVLFGEAAMRNGLRWGGGSAFENGIPSDWNHVDLGPRTDRIAQQYRASQQG